MMNRTNIDVLHEYVFKADEMGIRNMNGTIDMIRRLYAAKSNKKVLITKWYKNDGTIQVTVKAA